MMTTTKFAEAQLPQTTTTVTSTVYASHKLPAASGQGTTARRRRSRDGQLRGKNARAKDAVSTNF
jgi:predicted thioesterase